MTSDLFSTGNASPAPPNAFDRLTVWLFGQRGCQGLAANLRRARCQELRNGTLRVVFGLDSKVSRDFVRDNKDRLVEQLAIRWGCPASSIAIEINTL